MQWPPANYRGRAASSVWRARHEATGQEVALKLLTAGGESAALKAWGDARLREFKAMLGFFFPGYLVTLAGAVLAGLVALAGWGLVTAAIGASPGRIVTLVAASAVGLAALVVYLLYSRIMGIPELPQAVRLLRAALRRGGEA